MRFPPRPCRHAETYPLANILLAHASWSSGVQAVFGELDFVRQFGQIAADS